MTDHPLHGLDLSDPAIIEQYDRNEPRQIFPVVYGRDLAAGVLGWTRRSRDAIEIVRGYELAQSGLATSKRRFGSKLIRNPSDWRAVILVNRTSDIRAAVSSDYSRHHATFEQSSYSDHGWTDTND